MLVQIRVFFCLLLLLFLCSLFKVKVYDSPPRYLVYLAMSRHNPFKARTVAGLFVLICKAIKLDLYEN